MNSIEFNLFIQFQLVTTKQISFDEESTFRLLPSWMICPFPSKMTPLQMSDFRSNRICEKAKAATNTYRSGIQSFIRCPMCVSYHLKLTHDNISNNLILMTFISRYLLDTLIDWFAQEVSVKSTRASSYWRVHLRSKVKYKFKDTFLRTCFDFYYNQSRHIYTFSPEVVIRGWYSVERNIAKAL